MINFRKYRSFGWKNRLYVMANGESLDIDIGKRRFCFRWFSAEDGTTWSPSAHTFVRTWSY